MEVFRWKAWWGIAPAVLLGLATGFAQAQSVVPSVAQPVVVAPAEQSVRDDERLRILQAELVELQQRADAATKQRAERLAAHDGAAADEADQAHARAVADIAALQREIGSVRPPGAAKAVTVSRSAVSRDTAWWDVYARTPGHLRDAGSATP